jgi:ribonuclease HI
MNLTIHIDGGSRGNPGPAAAGVTIRNSDTSATLHEGGYFLGTATNNVAEYQGLLTALRVATGMDASRLTIYSDSQLMVRQITGSYRVKSAPLKKLHDQAQSLLRGFEQWKITHVLRDANKRADELANLAMDAGRDVIVLPAGDHSNEPPLQADAPDKRETQDRDSPCWTARLTGPTGPDCPARISQDQVFEFGPTTPAGFCVFAAQVVLDEALTPPPGGCDRQATCPRCGVGIKLDVSPAGAAKKK